MILSNSEIIEIKQRTMSLEKIIVDAKIEAGIQKV